MSKWEKLNKEFYDKINSLSDDEFNAWIDNQINHPTITLSDIIEDLIENKMVNTLLDLGVKINNGLIKIRSENKTYFNTNQRNTLLETLGLTKDDTVLFDHDWIVPFNFGLDEERINIFKKLMSIIKNPNGCKIMSIGNGRCTLNYIYPNPDCFIDISQTGIKVRISNDLSIFLFNDESYFLYNTEDSTIEPIYISRDLYYKSFDSLKCQPSKGGVSIVDISDIITDDTRGKKGTIDTLVKCTVYFSLD